MADEDSGGVLSVLKDSLMGYVRKIQIAVLICSIILIIFLINCIVQDQSAQCIPKNDFGNSSRFDLDLNTIGYIGIATANPYDEAGQIMNWVDTGYITTGDPLRIIVNGTWYPWGKDSTKTRTQTSYINTYTDSANFAYTVKETNSYVSCQLNTDLSPLIFLTVPKSAYSLSQVISNTNGILDQTNYLRRYTPSYSPVNDINNPDMDCIMGYNCTGEQRSVATQPLENCALARGAGIYMKIGDYTLNGDQINYAYHLINHLAPQIKQKCEADVSKNINCLFSYSSNPSGASILQQIPFTLPAQVYDLYYYNASTVPDIRESQIKLTSPFSSKIQSYSGETITMPYWSNAKFARHVKTALSDCSTDKLNTELINGQCYKYKYDIWNYYDGEVPVCPFDYTGNIALSKFPSEVCSPPPNQKIYLKVSTPNYQSADGVVTLIFENGARPLISKYKFGFIQDLLNTILAPFWGNQDPNPSILSTMTSFKVLNDNTIQIDFNSLIYSKVQNGDHFLSIGQNTNTGGFITVQDPSSGDNIPSVSYFSLTTTRNQITGTTAITIVKKTPDGILLDANSVRIYEVLKAKSDFLQLYDMESGLFAKTRNFILQNYIFQQAKVFLILASVMIYAFEIILGKKTLSLEEARSRLGRLFIIFWATDPQNYTLFDVYLLPFLINGIITFSSIFLDAASSIMGTSIAGQTTYDFYNQIIDMILSKQFFSKIMAVAFTSGGVLLYFIMFPILAISIFNVLKIVIGNILLLSITLLNVGVMVILGPIFALVSIIESRKSAFSGWIDSLKLDFMNLTLSLGIFGLFFGMVMNRLIAIINVEICWGTVQAIQLGSWHLFSLNTWVVQGQSDSAINVVLNSLVFYWLSGMLDQMTKIAQETASRLIGSGGGNVSMSHGAAIGDGIFNLGESAVSSFIEQASTKKEPEKKLESFTPRPNPNPNPRPNPTPFFTPRPNPTNPIPEEGKPGGGQNSNLNGGKPEIGSSGSQNLNGGKPEIGSSGSQNLNGGKPEVVQNPALGNQGSILELNPSSNNKAINSPGVNGSNSQNSTESRQINGSTDQQSEQRSPRNFIEENKRNIAANAMKAATTARKTKEVIGGQDNKNEEPNKKPEKVERINPAENEIKTGVIENDIGKSVGDDTFDFGAGSQGVAEGKSGEELKNGPLGDNQAENLIQPERDPNEELKEQKEKIEETKEKFKNAVAEIKAKQAEGDDDKK